MIIRLGAFLLSSTLLSFALTSNSYATILPPNDLDKYDNIGILGSTIDEQVFNEISDNIFKFYAPIVKQFGGELQFNKLWDDSTVNASAKQTGGKWEVNIYGGLARRSEITPDGFALVICHELGHHIAGYPYYGSNNWAASEGQSDYFATQTCAKKIWHNDLQANAEAKNSVNATVKKMCDLQYTNEAEQNLCYRTGNAGESLAQLMAALGGVKTISVDTPDSKQVKKTDVTHPQAQCRLDTYFAGALCPMVNADDVIPGRNEKAGQESLDAELKTTPYSCLTSYLQPVGSRPLCWFSPMEKTPIMELAQFNIVSSKGDGAIQPGDRVFAKPTIKNNTKNEVQDLELQLDSVLSSDIQSSASFKAAAIGAATTFGEFDPQAFDVSSTAKCGEKASFYFAVHSKTFAPGRLLYEDYFGRKVENTMMSNQRVEIPDSRWDDAEPTLEFTSANKIIGLTLMAELDHERLADIKMTLLTPWKERIEFPAFQKDQVGKVNVEFNIPNVKGDANGTFTLILKDQAKRKKGALLSWGLKTKTLSCAQN